MYKQTFRVLSKRLLTNINQNYKQTAIHDISKHLFNSNLWLKANTIAVTIPRKIELDTFPLIEQAWKEGKNVVIPKCYPNNDHQMKFYSFTNRHELENVYLDLYEPKEERHKLVYKEDIDLIIVPGLLFDHQGYRIGYGGGYYDRYLANFNQAKISIAMEEQIVKNLPFDHYDIPVDYIISNRKIYHC
ncbi:5-formyltetrahydrofolate cyclo-ligase [Alkalibacillus aidingensis]|uniref:5-formyltetrahydrofolate cyclo-ligase n=1 Tax=Alkalibacillus aidingensis TaxID=2747607 RepID=UPI001660CCC8|nr:5-formyltetrahydrofolate cyclo-ligase [Alkalibacillus aidingensis]